jgi:TolB protein
MIVALLLLILTACAGTAPISSSPTPTKATSAATPNLPTPPSPTLAPAVKQQTALLITNSPIELNFDLQDFPVGWQIESKGEFQGGYRFRALKLGIVPSLPEGIVVSWIRVFPGIDAARNNYIERRIQMADRFRLDDPRIAEESFIYEGNTIDEVFFRLRNVLVSVTMYTQYGGSLREVKQWAQKLEAKIDRTKRLGESLSTVPSLPGTPSTAATPAPAVALTPAVTPSSRVPTTPAVAPIPTVTTNPTATPKPLPTPTPLPPLVDVGSYPPGSLIAYQSRRDGGSGIYLASADGSFEVRLANENANNPSWSPDGKQIAFQLNGAIYIARIYGPGVVKLTEGGNPIWSPTGQTIAFLRLASGGRHDFYVINPDGTNLRNISNHPAQDEGTIWSPDGTKIAFLSERITGKGGFIADVGTGAVVPLLDPSTSQKVTSINFLAWSPDGRWVAFASDHEGKLEIYRVRPDGTGLTRMTTGAELGSVGLWWSPNGQQIAFISRRDGAAGNGDLYVIQPDGTGLRRLTHIGHVDFITWSPDGRRLAYERLGENQKREIFVLYLDKTAEYNLTKHPGSHVRPRWQPLAP